MSARNLETFDYYRIAAEARCDFRTARGFLEGTKRPHNFATRAAIAAAAVKCGYQIPDVLKREGLQPAAVAS